MKTKKLLLIFTTLLLNANVAFSGVVINSTRVIYPEGKNEINVRVESKNNYPTLVQSWIDGGQKDENVNKIKVPFVLLPPVARIEPYQGQTLRISYTGQDMTLPADRESVFWLNVLEIPPKATETKGNALQMAIRSRIKFFYRPQAIQQLSASEAAEKLNWRLVKDNGKTLIEAENTMPFHVSLSTITASANGKSVKENGRMIAPFSKETFVLSDATLRPNKISYIYINDFGASKTLEKGL
ncbi:fimbria/pilus periplasmic chaperone [Mixta intestinalis]|uniref:Putative fimbrial chaperone YadV n=1 Tax=Mixta intestinalis TaxID=1615494 RepID=A0A6P1Q5V3_9GAMM|nr:fimbria/pilus periplasmic chaperone [Mixta intestinalis]QHM73155.1 putative fimbrial chaperone YadV [Mixta intestinalis]